MSETAHERIGWWHGSIDQKLSNINNVYVTFLADATFWGIAPEIVTIVTNWNNLLATLVAKCKTTAASAHDRDIRDAKIAEAITYFTHTIYNLCQDLFLDGKMEIADLNNLGFLAKGQNGGHHDRLPIPTKKPSVKLEQTEADKVRVIFENSEGVNAKGKGPSWPDGVNGGMFRYKKRSESEDMWRYVHCTKIHTFIDMPAAWRGEEIHFQGAYYAHANDPHDQLHWSEPQVFLLHNSLLDDEAKAAKALADAKAEAEAAVAELAELKAQLAKNNG
jgi:hypothetical protein